jgi:hypothetical protein
MDPEKGFRRYVRKTGKGRFEMLEITDLTAGDKIGKKDWLNYSF